MHIERLSASAYECYSMCQWKYFLGYVAKLPDESGPAALLGSISHHVLEILSRASVNKHPKNSKIWDIEYLWKICFDRYAKTNPLIIDKLQPAKIRTVSKGLIDLIASEYSPVRNNTIAVEHYFKLPIKVDDGTYYISGFIDRIDQRDPDTIEIIDYKTGQRTDFKSKDRSKKDSVRLSEDIQPQIYYMAAKQLYPNVKNVVVSFIYIVDGGVVTALFSDEDVPTIQGRIVNRLRDIKSCNDPQRTTGWHCNVMCSFGKSGICDNLWEEKEDLGFEFVQNKYLTLKVNNGR